MPTRSGECSSGSGSGSAAAWPPVAVSGADAGGGLRRQCKAVSARSRAARIAPTSRVEVDSSSIPWIITMK